MDQLVLLREVGAERALPGSGRSYTRDDNGGLATKQRQAGKRCGGPGDEPRTKMMTNRRICVSGLLCMIGKMRFRAAVRPGERLPAVGLVKEGSASRGVRCLVIRWREDHLH